MIPWLFFATINHSFSFCLPSSLLSIERQKNLLEEKNKRPVFRQMLGK